MSLPSVETPRYELTLPSQDIKVQFRPFLVKEEKVLLTAIETGTEKDIQIATKEVLRACTFETIDVDKLPTFDIEYLFLQIRSKSVGEVSKFRVICPDDKQTYVDVEVDISKIEVQVDDAHTNNVLLDEQRKLGLVLKYPTLNEIQANVNIDQLNYDSIFDVIINCIDYIYEGEKSYPAKDSTKAELKTFVEGLSQNQFDKMRKFFETMPRLRHEIEVENPKTKVKSKVTFEGLADFFAYASPTTA